MKKIALCFSIILVLASCLKEKTKPLLDCPPISYTTDVRPIIESSCKTHTGPGTGCHDAWIDDYSQIAGLINKGSWQNRLFSVKDMPEIPNDWDIDSLTDGEIQIMKCWIQQGYQED